MIFSFVLVAYGLLVSLLCCVPIFLFFHIFLLLCNGSIFYCYLFSGVRCCVIFEDFVEGELIWFNVFNWSLIGTLDKFIPKNPRTLTVPHVMICGIHWKY